MLEKIKEKLKNLIDNCRESWNSISVKGKIGIAAVIVLIIALSLA
jgi:flagellar biosynthesis/type III secretory pathway M-ring protein FliF/YscJ